MRQASRKKRLGALDVFRDVAGEEQIEAFRL
jgi:hypothetical protein